MKKIFLVLGAVLFIIGLLIFVLPDTHSIGIIGGADGPTVIFVSGELWIFPIVAGIFLIVVSCVFLLKKKK